MTQDVVTLSGVLRPLGRGGQLLEFEDADGLRHTVFGQDKIVGAESIDALAVFIGDSDVHDYQHRAD